MLVFVVGLGQKADQAALWEFASTWSGMTRCHVEAVRHKTLRPIL
jgi:hypothetical protein